MITTARSLPVLPNEIAQNLTGRSYISYSEIKTFQTCPLRWQFQYVEKAPPESISAALLLGSGVHAAVERHFEALLAASPSPTLDQLMAAYRECWASELKETPVQYAKGQNAETTEATARRMLEHFIASPLSQPKGTIIGIEDEFRVRLAIDLPDLLGRVDIITHDADKSELVITDFKTARSAWTQATAEDQADQLLLYAEGCQSIARDLGATVKLQFIVVTKTKEPKIDALIVSLNPTRTARTQAMVRQVFRAMQTGIIYPVPSAMNCTGCAFTMACQAWNKEQSSEVPPLR